MKPFARGLRSEPAELTGAELWNLTQLSGRLVEISGSSASASLTLAFDLVRDTQERGEPVGWVMSRGSSFYPPDVAERGIDLDALVVVRVPAIKNAARAGEKLVRSGAFGLVAVDIGAADIAVPLQARLAALALKHHASVICLTEKESREPSLSSLISLRVHARRAQTSSGQSFSRLEVLKDKRHGPTWSHVKICNGGFFEHRC